MIAFLWLISLLLLFMGGWITIGNWGIALRPKGGSLIPILGGVFVAIAFAIIPVDAGHSFWLLPLIVDLGALPLLTVTGIFLVWRALRKWYEDQQ